MATEDKFSEKDLICPQCGEIFSLPVLLKCGHNFCQSCVKRFWDWKGQKICPACSTLSSFFKPPINLALKLKVDKYRAQMNNSTGDTGDTCLTHNEKFKIFCHNDEKLICLICQLSKQHKMHECSPVEEAVQHKKNEISKQLDFLKKELKTLHQTRATWRETKAYIQTQVNEDEAVIKEEFEMLHQFLREDEHTRLYELKLEAERKTAVISRKLETITEQIKDLSASISDVEKHLKAPDLAFLREYKRTKTRVKYNTQQQEPVPDCLINSAQHLGLLRFKICKQMSKLVNCVPVILDPNTAQHNLSISPDLSSVHSVKKRVLPDNPERCTSQMCVLGAVGFTSGKHSWTTEVGHTKDWSIGVALESIKRKDLVSLKPAEGIWAISLCQGDSLVVEAFPRVRLPMKNKLEKITVKLDYDKGKVLFINAADSTTIHTFKGKFTEQIFPYFSLGLPTVAQNQGTLTVCPMTVKVEAE
ncbi:unnamed protein product [Ophioblennius macclurei]